MSIVTGAEKFSIAETKMPAPGRAPPMHIVTGARKFSIAETKTPAPGRAPPTIVVTGAGGAGAAPDGTGGRTRGFFSPP